MLQSNQTGDFPVASVLSQTELWVYRAKNGVEYCMKPDSRIPSLLTHLRQSSEAQLSNLEIMHFIHQLSHTQNQAETEGNTCSCSFPFLYHSVELDNPYLIAMQNESYRPANRRWLYSDVMPQFSTDSMVSQNEYEALLDSMPDTLRKKIQKNIISEAQKYLGTKYRWGGMSPSGFDCSGLVGYVFQSFGVELPRTSHRQSKLGQLIVEKTKIKTGDLIFFGYRRGKTYRTKHVGIVVENRNGQLKVLHSSTRRGVIIDDDILSKPYYKRRFLFVKRFV